MATNSEYLNSAEAAEYLHLSDRTVRSLCTDRKIRHERLNGRNVRFKKEWLDEYLQSIQVAPIQNLNEEGENKND